MSMREVCPRETLPGLVPVMPGAATTVNACAVVAVPLTLLTVIGPLTAPEGTDATSECGVASVMAAGVPLKLTAFCAGLEMKPAPKIVTASPTRPLDGEKPSTRNCVEE